MMTKESKPNMISKCSPAETMTDAISSQSSPILTPKATSNHKDNLSSSSNTTGVKTSDTDASKPIVVPVSGSPRDIICGRGLHIMNRHGNHNLHLVVDRYRQTYLTATRRDKAAITQHIVKQLKSTGARFLRRFNDGSDDKWVEVDDKTAYKKVSHALRLRKDDHGQNFLQSLPGQQAGSQQHVPLHSKSSSQHIPIGPQSTVATQSAIPPGVGTHIPPTLPLSVLPLAPPVNQLEVMATQSALPVALGRHAQPILYPSVPNGYGNVTIDPRLFADAFATTLATMTQLQRQQRSLFSGSSIDGQRSGRNSEEERK
ncbi:unnamed protein product [Cylindrotheca closterium]|uniref:DUF6824 domain-containing protein n=1 Tax=Cylindrotheca closterium TaxID=2856 RepID=A0AAD2FTG6_9STRA|nr:unnamed protein product [Cylindrotheca closterium]